MNEKQRVKTSKFLSLVLRHEPEAIGLELDVAGWVTVDKLLAALTRHGRQVSRAELEEVVETNEKKRFEFSDDGQRIRASQGHSVEVELGYTPQEPPEFLYHGTATRFLGSIMVEGLQKGERHHVHLSAQTTTAHQVGTRHGKPVLLTIKARAMHEAGHPFFLSTNGVWLAESVPVEFIVPPEGNAGAVLGK
jgi:putative RNA 2'-phosphotransferase